ncbi:MAG: hypothetical protein AAGB15_15185, partial [Pseudomonadota bacterium]
MVSTTDSMVDRALGATFTKSIDHFSRFTGLAVGNLYILAAAFTLIEVIARYAFNQSQQWVFEMVMTLCAAA